MSFKIDQAFIQAFIDGAFGLPIAHENLDYDPVAGDEYAELIMIPNDITAYSLNDSDETDGLFRIILRWPLNKGSISPKIKADQIFAAFSIGTIVCMTGQCATVLSTSRQEGVAEEGWYKLILTVGYFANIKRN